MNELKTNLDNLADALEEMMFSDDCVEWLRQGEEADNVTVDMLTELKKVVNGLNALGVLPEVVKHIKRRIEDPVPEPEISSNNMIKWVNWYRETHNVSVGTAHLVAKERLKESI